MPRIRLRRPYAAITLAAAVACTADPVSLCGCSLPPPYVIVYGTVSAPGGAPVADATVHADAGPPGCQTAVESRDVQTDATGRFRVLTGGSGGDAQTCIRLVALAPAGSGLASSDTTRINVPTPQRHPPDSVRHNLSLRAP